MYVSGPQSGKSTNRWFRRSNSSPNVSRGMTPSKTASPPGISKHSNGALRPSTVNRTSPKIRAEADPVAVSVCTSRTKVSPNREMMDAGRQRMDAPVSTRTPSTVTRRTSFSGMSPWRARARSSLFSRVIVVRIWPTCRCRPSAPGNTSPSFMHSVYGRRPGRKPRGAAPRARTCSSPVRASPGTTSRLPGIPARASRLFGSPTRTPGAVRVSPSGRCAGRAG